jgi:plasmid replication initiation protein
MFGDIDTILKVTYKKGSNMRTLVKKSHHMVTAGFSITAREQDVLTLIFKELKKSEEAITFGEEEPENLKLDFTFTTAQLNKVFGTSRQNTYEIMETVAKGLMGKTATVKRIADKSKKGAKKNTTRILSLCSFAEYNEGMLSLSIDKNTAYYMLDYTKGFSEIDFKLSLSLNGAHEKRLLDLISRFKQNQYTCTLGEFYILLGSNPSHYSSFTVFRRSVLDKPMKRLIERSSGAWVATDNKGLGYMISKTGRSYTESSRLTLTVKFVNVLRDSAGLYPY